MKLEEEAKPTVNQAPTGREIVENYLKGDVTAAVLYRKICNALETFEQWESEAPKIQLLDQFLNIADAMEARTETLVKRLLVSLNFNFCEVINEIKIYSYFRVSDGIKFLDQ